MRLQVADRHPGAGHDWVQGRLDWPHRGVRNWRWRLSGGNWETIIILYLWLNWDFQGELPEGRHCRVENKNFYFDIGQNNRGIYMRISEVKTNFRTAITIPEKSWSRSDMTLISWEVMDNFHFQIPWYFRWLRGQDEGGCGGRRSWKGWKISFQNFVPVVNFWSADILTVFQSSLDLCWFFSLSKVDFSEIGAVSA